VIAAIVLGLLLGWCARAGGEGVRAGARRRAYTFGAREVVVAMKETHDHR